MIQIVLSVAVLAATIVTLANIIMRDDSEIRHLPKVLWIILVVIVPIIGMVLWWAIGREREIRHDPVPFGDPRRYEAVRMPQPTFDDDEDIEARVEREIAFHENEARIRRLEAQLREKRDAAE